MNIESIGSLASYSVEGYISEDKIRLLKTEDIEVTPEELAAEDQVIRNFLLQEILMIVAGDVRSYKSFLEIDNQVQEALQRIPAAKDLLAMLDNERGKL